MTRNMVIFSIIIQLLDGVSTSHSFSSALEELNLFMHSDRKSHLSCILFGDTACQITCDVLCDLYGCQSQAKCKDFISCDCGEIYTVNSKQLTIDQYKKLNLTDLWYHYFAKSLVSRRLLSKISRLDANFISNLTSLLRQPHMTGIVVRNELLKVYPKWLLVHYVRPLERGHIREIFDDDITKGINAERFKSYIDKTIDSIVNRQWSQIKMMTNGIFALPSLFKCLTDEKNGRYIISQLLWFPNNTLLDLISEYSQRVEFYDFFRTPNSTLTASDTENIAYNSLKSHIFQAIENLTDQLFDKIHDMKRNHELLRLTNYIRNKNDVKNLLSLILMFPNDSMFELMRNLIMQQHNDTYTIRQSSSTRLHILPHQIDELVAASVLERLLRMKIHFEDLAKLRTRFRLTTLTPTTTKQKPTTIEREPISISFYNRIKRLLSFNV